MKKIFYIVLVIVALLVVAQFVKNQKAEDANVETVTTTEVINVEENADGTVSATDDVIITDDEGDVAEESVEVIEENPGATADDDETVVAE